MDQEELVDIKNILEKKLKECSSRIQERKAGLCCKEDYRNRSSGYGDDGVIVGPEEEVTVRILTAAAEECRQAHGALKKIKENTYV